MIQKTDLEERIRNLLDYELGKHVIISGTLPNPVDRNEIYLTVADQLGVHKVMVRKIARKLMVDYIAKVQTLSDTKKRNLRTKEV